MICFTNTKIRKILRSIALAAILSFVSLKPVFSQNPPPVPSGQDTSAQAQRFETEVEQKKRAIERKKPKAPEIEVEEPTAPPSAEETIVFTLSDITVTDCTVFKPEELRPLYESYLGKQVSFKEIQEIADKIKAKYHEKGYLTTIAYIPEQEIKEGKVEIKVAEGRMGELKIDGNKSFSTSQLERYFHTKKNEILNIKKLQRDILRLNQNPDLEIKSIISAGKEPGTSDVTLKVTERFPYHVGGGFDNQGTRLSGKPRALITFRSTNVTGHMDSLYANTLFAARSFGESVMYSLPVNTYGTRIGFNFAYFKSKLGAEYKQYNIKGNTTIYTPHIQQEIYLSEDMQVDSDFGLEIKCIRKRIEGNLTASDQLRQPYFSFDITKLDRLFGGGQTTYSPLFKFGVPHFLGGSKHNHPTSSRPGTGGFFFKYEHSLRRMQRMPFESYAILRSALQLTSHTLTPSEQFSLGGANYIRGYPEGDYLADEGASLNADWLFPMYLFPKEWKLPYSDTPLRNQVEPVLFMDIGGGRMKNVVAGEHRVRFLMGLGGGFRVRIARNIFARFEWADRVGDKRTGAAAPSSFHVSIQCET
ncbi:MAG: ShlB/FhaC/HecB family hemolysin secretion/activation protein [Candidatus Omnitrophica bacterium]|nr:ShlB/FhaC/HecB family hemolysin secretion/activation protein [Candidatus Omnitrophota bacterium]